MEMTPGQIMEAEISATLLDDPSSPWVVIRRTVCEVNLICLTMYFFVVNTMIVLPSTYDKDHDGKVFPPSYCPPMPDNVFSVASPSAPIAPRWRYSASSSSLSPPITSRGRWQQCSVTIIILILIFFSCPGLDSDFDQVIWTLVCYFHICRLEIVWIFYLYPPLLYFYHTFIFSHFVSLLHFFHFYIFSLLFFFTFIFSHFYIFSLFVSCRSSPPQSSLHLLLPSEC